MSHNIFTLVRLTEEAKPYNTAITRRGAMNLMKSGFIQNGYFLLLTFVTGLFYFCFYMVALSFSLSLSFIVIGIPLFTRVLRTTTTFIQFERTQTKIYTDITTAHYDKKITTDAPIWGSCQIRTYGTSQLARRLLVNAEVGDRTRQSRQRSRSLFNTACIPVGTHFVSIHRYECHFHGSRYFCEITPYHGSGSCACRNKRQVG